MYLGNIDIKNEPRQTLPIHNNGQAPRKNQNAFPHTSETSVGRGSDGIVSQTEMDVNTNSENNFDNYIKRMVNDNELTLIKRKAPKSEVEGQTISQRYNSGASDNSIHNTEADVNSNSNNSSGTGKNALTADLDNIVDSGGGTEQKRSKAEMAANREIEELVRRYDGGEIGREELSDGIKGALSVMNAGAKTEIGEKLKKAEKRIARQNEQLIEQRRTARQNAEQKVSDANKSQFLLLRH